MKPLSWNKTRRVLAAAVCALACSVVAARSLPANTIPAPQPVDYPGTLELEVDATDLERRVFRVRQRLPVQAGRLTLLLPRWLPGTHGPAGSVDRLAGLVVRTDGGATLPWLRDTLEAFAFHIDVPAGTTALQLEFQHLSPLDARNARVVMTPELLNLQWHAMVLYPAGHDSSHIQVRPSVRLPAAWQQASALRVVATQGDTVRFAPVSLETLVDSPLFAGRHTCSLALDGPGSARPVWLHLFADHPEALQASDAQIGAHRHLVEQADRLFGARHFGQYHFLLAQSEQMGGIGLEHHESSENAVRLGYFKDWSKRAGPRDLLPHEYVHSWNGKFRRPADLWTPNFNTPMQDSLLWLYEGQTQFWGRVLAARSGLTSPEQARHALAQVVASLEYRAGRTWRPLQDTTNEPIMGSRRGKDWGNWQRGADYYDEAALVWLEADGLIRQRSGERRSLDDFARRFFGVHDGRVQPLTYTYADIVATLNDVLPYDWAAFLRQRLDHYDPEGPRKTLAHSGWRLHYTDQPSDFARHDERDDRGEDFAYSLGLMVQKDGKLETVLWGSPAFDAGLSRAQQLVAVNGKAYKSERLAQAIRANRDGSAPMELLLRDADTYRTVRIDYRGGLRYPHLERVSEQPERLDTGLFAPRGL